MSQLPGNPIGSGGKEPVDPETETMSATFIHEGNSIDHTPAADVAAGDVVIVPENLTAGQYRRQLTRLGPKTIQLRRRSQERKLNLY